MRINGETHRRHSVSLSADSFLVSTNESHTLAKNVANLVAIQPSISLEAADRSKFEIFEEGFFIDTRHEI